LVSVGADQTCKIWGWRPDKSNALRILRNHAQPISCLAMTPTREFLVTGSLDRTVKLTDLDPGEATLSPDLVLSNESRSFAKERITFTGHTRPVRALAVSNDRLTIVSADDQGVLRLWRSLRAAAVNPPPER
jgi:WD40 repeat protein